MSGTDALPSSLTAERATELLQRAGRLASGARVSSVTRESSRNTIISLLQRIRLDYEGDAKGAPRHLLLKTARTDGAVSFVEQGRKEAAFYADVAPLSPPGLLVPCFETVSRESEARHEVLLEDLSETHRVPADWPVAPAVDACEQILDAYARFHAAWWDDARLGTSIGRFLDASDVDQFVTHFAERWTQFRAMLGDRLSADRAQRYERLLQAMPRLLDRYRSHRHLTIVNGDAHVWNALYPNDPAETLRLIDWAGWRIDTATDDLAYMMALHWYPERRARLERRLLHRYHEQLVTHGVDGYGFEALFEDYRLSALWQITIPVWQATAKLPAPIWWSHFERAMLAFEDLRCADLLD
jgi:hypothetical protein